MSMPSSYSDHQHTTPPTSYAALLLRPFMTPLFYHAAMIPSKPTTPTPRRQRIILLVFESAKPRRREHEASAISSIHGLHSFLRKARCKLLERLAAYFKKGSISWRQFLVIWLLDSYI